MTDTKPPPCIGADPLCPCQDGDACHYRDTPKTKGFPLPKPPLPAVVLRADAHYSGEGLADAVRDAIDAAVAAERERARVQTHVIVLAAVHHAVNACKDASGQRSTIERFVNKIDIANEVMAAFEDGASKGTI